MLIMLRHGRTPANAQGLLQGRIDPDLDDIGQRQAAAAAAWLGPVDRVVTSPLARARQTAGYLSDEVEVDERFIELDYGDWEGRPVRDVAPQTWQAWRQDLGFRPPNGESLLELGARVRSALEELVADASERRVVVVSHVSPIKAAVAWAVGVDDTMTWRTRLGHASISRIDFNAQTPQLTGFNDLGHLRSLDEHP